MSLFQVCLQLPLPPPCKRMGETWRSSQLMANQHGWIHVPCLWPASMNNEQHAWQVRPTKQEPEMQKRHSPVQHLSLRRLVDATYPGGFNKWYISTTNVASISCNLFIKSNLWTHCVSLWFKYLGPEGLCRHPNREMWPTMAYSSVAPGPCKWMKENKTTNFLICVCDGMKQTPTAPSGLARSTLLRTRTTRPWIAQETPKLQVQMALGFKWVARKGSTWHNLEGQKVFNASRTNMQRIRPLDWCRLINYFLFCGMENRHQSPSGQRGTW